MLTFDEAREFINNASKRGSVLGLESIENLMEELSALVLGASCQESVQAPLRRENCQESALVQQQEQNCRGCQEGALVPLQDQLPVIHIAGTNGKGSVGAYLASIFREAGFHVARYTSPAVFDPLEVWQYDGENISQDEYAQIMSQVKSACDILVSKGKPCPTVFEIETAAAFLYFYLRKPDVALVEVGMGGLTDATNVIRSPLASVITTISFDHMQFLGNSIEEIAEVKAGIIKQGCPAFSAEQLPEVKAVLLRKIKENKTTIKFVENNKLELLEQKPGNLEFTYRWEAGLDQPQDVAGAGDVAGDKLLLRTKMAGSYQMKNAALAVECAVSLLPKLLPGLLPEVSRTYITEGIAKATWQGRFEVVARDPYVILDGAHNEDAAWQLAKTLQNCFTNKRITYIIGVLADKEHEKMLRIMLPMAERIYTVTPDNPRAMKGEDLAEEARKIDPEKQIISCANCKEALKLAREEADVVLAFGSLSYLAEMKRSL